MTAMTLITAVSIGLFLLVFWVTGIVSIAKRAFVTMRGAVHSIGDPGLDEFARERAVQTAAIGLVIASGSLILRSFLALAAAFVPIFTADWLGIVPRGRMLAFMERWDVILIATVVVTMGYVVGARLWSR